MNRARVFVISYFIFLAVVTHYLWASQNPVEPTSQNTWVIRKPKPYEYNYSIPQPKIRELPTREQMLCKWMLFTNKQTYYDPILNVTWYANPELKSCSYLSEAY